MFEFARDHDACPAPLNYRGYRKSICTSINHVKTCNPVRVTYTGRLDMCLGHEEAADLRTPLRVSEGNDLLKMAMRDAIARKLKGHDFIIDRTSRRPAVARHMSVTGG